ncbi:MAG: HPr family phosphocarrier protein [Gammaproteobacteria bacterium]|nr:HPr family phosphocarrier protein [Gammaproteobacteria bacterium]
MIRRTVTIINKLGLHARAAARFVRLASQFSSDIKLARTATEINGKSILGVMMLAAAKGTELEIIVDGRDEAEAMAALVALIDNRFDEGE